MKRRFFFGLLTPGRIIFILILIYIALLTVPYLRHKKFQKIFRMTSVRESFTAPRRKRADRLHKRQHRRSSLSPSDHPTGRAGNYSLPLTLTRDKGGKDVMAALMSAADRGVKVRVIIDGFSGFLDVKGKGTRGFRLWPPMRTFLFASTIRSRL